MSNRRPRRVALTLLIAAATIAAEAQNPDARRARRRTPVVDVFEQSKDAVVNISTSRLIQVRSGGMSLLDEFFDRPRSRRSARVEAVGSGFVVHEDGYIVTNAHVVAQADELRVIFADGREFPGQAIAVDRRHDLAVVKIDAGGRLPFIRLGRSDDLMIGETVIAIGNPVGLQHSVTAGVISATQREIDVREDVELTGLIQTDASINPGNSGGPLLNVNAELIGINTAIRGDAQNIGFAIPVDQLWELLPQMLDIERRQRVTLGVQISGPDAQVRAVAAGSPAARAGLSVADRVRKLDGAVVRDGIDYYVKLLTKTAGESLRFEVERGGRAITADIPLQTLPPPDGAELARRVLGATIVEVPDDILAEYGVPGYARLLVEDVDRNSPAARVRIRAGDFLIGVDRVPVKTLEGLGLVLEKVNSGDMLLLDGLRWKSDPPYRWTVETRAR